MFAMRIKPLLPLLILLVFITGFLPGLFAQQLKKQYEKTPDGVLFYPDVNGAGNTRVIGSR